MLKESAYQCRIHRRCKFDPWGGNISQWRTWQPTPVFLPGESHEQRSLAGYSPWGRKELEHAHKDRWIRASFQQQLRVLDSIPKEMKLA